MATKVTNDQHKIDILALARLVLLDRNGKEVLISSFWKTEPAVLIFLRHFSCIACRTYVELIWNKKEELKKSKTRVIFVGNGAPHFINMFKEDLDIPEADIYTDPTLQTYDACGLIRGIFHLMDPRGALKMVEFAIAGKKQGKWDSNSGTHTQMGGIVALKPPGIVVYHYIEDYLGDFDTSEDWKHSVKE